MTDFKENYGLPPGFVLEHPIEEPAAEATDNNYGLPPGFVLEEPSIAGGFLRSLGQGATADWGDEIVGAVGGDEAKESYRAKQHAFEEEHPYLDMTAKGAGAVGSTLGLAFVPGGQIAALGRAGAMGNRVLQGLRSMFGAGNAAKAIPGANAAVNLGSRVSQIPGVSRVANFVAGTNARRGGLAAAEYGATSRAGKYEGAPNIEGDGRDDADTFMDDALGRIGAAADPSSIALDYTLGTGLTRGFNDLMPRVANALDGARTAIARARGETGSGSGSVAVAKRLRADDVTPQQMRDQILPEYRGLQQNQIADVMESYGDLIASGATDVAARQQVAQHLASQGVNPRTAQVQVNEIVQRYQGRNAVPSQINELAAMAQGGDAVSTHRQFEAGINMARDGSEASQVSNFMSGRQPQARGQISDALEGQLGDGDVGRMLQEYELRRDAMNEGYGPIIESFNGNPEAQAALRRQIDMARLEVEARLGNRADDMANEVRTQMGKFSNPEQRYIPGETPPATPQAPRPMTPDGSPTPPPELPPPGPGQVQDLGRRGTMDLEGFIHQRRALTDAIEGSKDKFGRDTAMTTDLRELKRGIDQRVRGIADDASVPEDARQIFGDWSQANDARRDLEAMRRAYTDGISMNTNAKGKSVINMEMTMRRVNRMSNDQQDMFARGIMARIKSDIETGGDFHDIAKLFNSNRMRSILSRMMGDRQASEFNQLVRRAGLATRSQRADKNSPTARIRDEKEAEMVLSKLRNAVDLMISPKRLVGAVADFADDQMFRTKNEAVMRILGANTDEPHNVLRTLRDLEASMRYQDPTVVSPYIGQSGPFISIPSREILSETDEETYH